MEEQVLIKIEDGIDSSIEKKFENIATLAEKIDKQLQQIDKTLSKLSNAGFKSVGDTATSIQKRIESMFSGFNAGAKTATANASDWKEMLKEQNLAVKAAFNVQQQWNKALSEEAILDGKINRRNSALEAQANAKAIKEEELALTQYNSAMLKSQTLASKTQLKVDRSNLASQLKEEAQAEKDSAQAMKIAEREANSLEKSKERLAMQTNSLEGVTYRYNQQIKQLNLDFKEGERDSIQYKAALANIENSYAMGVNRIGAMNKVLGVTGDKTRLARHEMLNLSYQLQDVVVGFASGQRPMTIFLQQGSQIAQVAAASGLGIKGVTTAIKDMTVSGLSMIGRLALNPYFLAIATAAGLATSAFNSLQNELSDNSGIEDMRYQIALAGGDVGAFNTELKKLGGETVTLKDILGTLFDELDFSPAMTKFGEFEDWLNQRFYNIARAGFAFKEASKSFLATENFDDAIDRGNAAMGEFDKWWQDLKKKFQEPLKARIDLADLKASGKDFDSVEKKYQSTMDSISKSIKDFDREHEQKINDINARWSNLGLGAAETNKDRLADIAKENQRYEEQITQYKEQQANKRNRLDKEQISLANQRASAMQRLLEIESKTGFGVGITSVQKEYSKMKTDVEQDLRKGLISQSDADKAFGQLKVWLDTELPRATVKSIVAFNQLKDPLYSFNENIDWQTESFGLLGDEYDNFNEYQQVYNELLSQGIDLDVSKNKQLDEKIKKTIKATSEDSKLATAMRAIYDASPIAQLQDNARKQDALNKLIAKGGNDVDYYRNELEKLKQSENAIIATQQGWGDTFNSIIKPSEELTNKIKDLNNALMNRPDLSAYVDLQKQLSQNQETQITFTTVGAGDIYGETQGKLDSLSVSQKQWNNARNAGLVTENEYLMATRKNIVAMDELRQVQGKSAFGEDMIFGLKNLASEWQGVHSEMALISDEFFSSFSSGFSNAIAGAIIDGDSLKESMYQLSKTILTQVVSSLVQATIQATIFKAALSMGIGSFFGAGSFGATGASSSVSGGVTGGANPFGITSVFGLAKGGYVVGGGTTTSDSIPTMLSNKEFVVNANATAKNRALLEAINRGANVSPMAKSSSPSASLAKNIPNMNIYIDNNANGVNIRTEQLSDTDVRIICEQVVAEKTDSAIAASRSNPYSKMNRADTRYTTITRKI